MQSLIERFQDLIEPIQTTLGDIEEGRTAEEAADGEQVERVQRTLALQQATQRITSNTMALQKLRSHFQKVRHLCWFGLTWCSFWVCKFAGPLVYIGKGS